MGSKFYGISQIGSKIYRNSIYYSNNYLTIKWVETKAFCDNMVKSIVEFIYEQIITHFGCSIRLVSD